MPVCKKSQLPPSIWDNGALIVPPFAWEAYKKQLVDRELLTRALGPEPKRKDILGGESIDETHLHFAFRFAGSVARVQNVMIDPKTKFNDIPDEIIQTLSSHSISILDIPCGAGAASLALLTTLFELRKNKLIPKLPVNFRITAADISQEALDIFNQLMNHIEPALTEVGIHVEWTVEYWDANRLDTMAQLCDAWLGAKSNNEYLLLISAISGDGSKNVDAFERAFDHCTARMWDVRGACLWIEPGSKGAVKFLKNFIEAIKKRWAWMSPVGATHSALNDEFQWWHELRAEQLTGHSSVIHYKKS